MDFIWSYKKKVVTLRTFRYEQNKKNKHTTN